MKITLKNARAPFTGSIIDICNLVAGRERFRIQQTPLLGEILWDDDSTIEIEHPFDGDALFQKTGIEIELHWFDGGGKPKELGKIHIGTKWTGPILWIDVQTGKNWSVFSHGNYGNKYASGGNWTHVASPSHSLRASSEEEIAAGRGHLTHQGTPNEGFSSLREAFDYRFDRKNIALRGQDKLFTEAPELRDHVEKVLTEIGLL